MTDRASAPIAYILCELKSRDLESGLSIADHLLDAGFCVVIGQFWAICKNLVWGDAPKGAVLFRTANHVQAGIMKQCHDAGHAVVAMDEEALPFIHADGFLSNLDRAALDYPFCAQSAAHAAVLREHFPKADIRVTGSARVDLLRNNSYRPEAGPYVLINTTFGLVNSVWGSEQTAVARMMSAQPMPKEELHTRQRIERATYDQMTALIEWLAPQYPVVVRPHPAENPDTWRKAKGIRVVAGSNPIPWLLGATVTVHGNSTTGLKAAILGCPAINISPPEFDAWTARFATRTLNLTVPDAQSAIEPITAYINGRGPKVTPPDFPADGSRLIAETVSTRLPAPARMDDPSWAVSPRTDAQRGKFTATLEEVKSKLPPMHVRQLDDSVFLLVR